MKELETIEGFGVASYAEKGKYLTITSLKPGKNVFRILPPMKSQANTGKWSNYYCIHSGYRVENSLNLFHCVGQMGFYKTGNQPKCFECEKIQEMQKNALLAKTEKNKRVEESVNGWLKNHYLSKNHYVNVMMSDRTFQVLKIGHRVKQMIDTVFKQLKEGDQIDPTAINQGVWIIVTKTDNMRDVPNVGVKRKGEGCSSPVELAPLTKEECKRALDECMDLVQDQHKLAKTLSSEQIELLTKISGEPDEIAAIFEGNPETLEVLKERYRDVGSILDMSQKELERQLGISDEVPF
jgi:hypothetical protein